jgi:hypothetical protein
MTLKEELHALIDELPDDATIEDVQYHLYVADLLRQRAAMLEKAELVPQAEVEKRFAKWLTK